MSDPPFIADPSEPEPDSVTIIVQAMRDKFGEQAIHIAEGQLFTASAESREKWLEIVARLTAEKTTSDD